LPFFPPVRGGFFLCFTLTLALSLRERGQIEHGLALPPLAGEDRSGADLPFPLSLWERAGVRGKKIK